MLSLVLIKISFFTFQRKWFLDSVSPSSYCPDVSIPSLLLTLFTIVLWPHTHHSADIFLETLINALLGVIFDGKFCFSSSLTLFMILVLFTTFFSNFYFYVNCFLLLWSSQCSLELYFYLSIPYMLGFSSPLFLVLFSCYSTRVILSPSILLSTFSCS